MEGIRQTRSTNPGATWDKLNWRDLSPEEKETWKVLGWDEASWQEDKRAPHSDSKYWSDLNAYEQLAAEALGFLQPTWDA